MAIRIQRRFDPAAFARCHAEIERRLVEPRTRAQRRAIRRRGRFVVAAILTQQRQAVPTLRMQRIDRDAALERLRRRFDAIARGQRPPVQMMRPGRLWPGQGIQSTQAAIDGRERRIVLAAVEQRIADRQPATGEILVPLERGQQRERVGIAVPQQQGGEAEERLRLVRRRRVCRACGVQRRVGGGAWLRPARGVRGGWARRPSDRGRP